MESLYGNLKDVLEMTWPTLFISLVLLVSIRISYLIKNKVKFVFHREISLLLFVLYILCLFQVVTSQDINTLSGNNFTLFVEIFRYKIGSRLFIKNIVGNVVMFIPYGFFAGKYASKKNFFLSLFLVLLASISIECTQLAIGRVFDVDDIILNVIGGVIGYFIYVILDKIYSLLPKVFKKDWFLNLLAIILVVVIAFLVVAIMM